VLSPSPCIIAAGEEFNIAVDGITDFLKKPTKSLQHALESWFALFWILSIQYPESLKHTCCFLEKVVLKKGGKISGPVRKWANRLMA
jgi:hypothetical protein